MRLGDRVESGEGLIIQQTAALLPTAKTDAICLIHLNGHVPPFGGGVDVAPQVLGVIQQRDEHWLGRRGRRSSVETQNRKRSGIPAARS